MVGGVEDGAPGRAGARPRHPSARPPLARASRVGRVDPTLPQPTLPQPTAAHYSPDVLECMADSRAADWEDLMADGGLPWWLQARAHGVEAADGWAEGWAGARAVGCATATPYISFTSLPSPPPQPFSS